MAKRTLSQKKDREGSRLTNNPNPKLTTREAQVVDCLLRILRDGSRRQQKAIEDLLRLLSGDVKARLAEARKKPRGGAR